MTRHFLSRALTGACMAGALGIGAAWAQTGQGTTDYKTTETKTTETKTTETKTPGMKPAPGTTGQTTPSPVPVPSTTGTTPTPTTALTAKEAKSAKPVLQEIQNVNNLEIALGRLAQQKAESQNIKDYAHLLIIDHQGAQKKVMDFANANNIMLTGTMPAVREIPPTATDPGMRPPAGATAGTTPGTPPGAPGSGAATAAGTGTTNPAAGTTGTASDIAPMVELDAQGRKTLARFEKLEGVKFEKAYLTEMVRGHSKMAAKLKSAEKRAQNPELKTLLGDVRGSVEMHLDKAKELQKAGST